MEELNDKLQDKKVIGLKWVHNVKNNKDKTINKYKSKLVANGYTQQLDMIFNKTYTLVVRMETINTNITTPSVSPSKSNLQS